MVYLKLLILFSVMAASIGVCPPIMRRWQWNARPPKGTAQMTLPVPYVIIHHSVMGEGNCSTIAGCIEVMKEIQDFHMDGNGWDDVGYTFLIGGDGYVYEGRGWNRQGAHAPNYNDKSIGICFIGLFTDKLPTEMQIQTAKTLIECGIENNYIKSDYILYGHRDVRDTECPGETLYQEISTWPHKGPKP